VGSVRVGSTARGSLRIPAPNAGTVVFTIRLEGFATEQQTVTTDGTSTPITVVVRLRPSNVARPSAPPASPSPPSKAAPAPAPQPTPLPAVDQPTHPPALETQGGGHKGLVLGILGTAAAGAAVAIVVEKHHSGCPNSPSGSNSSLSQGGAFTIKVAPDLTGQVNCNTPTQPITVTGTNLDCSPVTIMSASVSVSQASGACSGGAFTRTLKVIASAVPPGGTNVPIAEGVIGNSVAGCCNGGSCGSSSFQCNEDEVYTVQTSKGPVTSSNPYTILFPAGLSCVPCDLSAASCRGAAQ